MERHMTVIAALVIRATLLGSAGWLGALGVPRATGECTTDVLSFNYAWGPGGVLYGPDDIDINALTTWDPDGPGKSNCRGRRADR